MYVGSPYQCVVVLGSGKFVELLFQVLSERIVGRRQVGNHIWLARRGVFSLVLSMACEIRIFLTL